KLVPIFGTAGHLLEAKVLVCFGTIKNDVARAGTEDRRDLRHARDALLEVAEHLVRAAGDGMALHAAGLAEEEQRAALFAGAHRVPSATRELIDRRIGKDERELELGDGLAEHDEVDRRSRGDLRKDPRKAIAVRKRHGIQVLERLGANRLVAESRTV